MTDSRRSARGQSLPPEHAARLRELIPGSTLFLSLVVSLYREGWTLRAIGEAFDPPVPRSTVYSWVANAPSSTEITKVPTPEIKTPVKYERKTVPAKPIPKFYQTILPSLADTARKYRSGMADDSTPARANISFTNTVLRLRDDGHTIQQIADAARVSPKAIRNRIEKGRSV